MANRYIVTCVNPACRAQFGIDKYKVPQGQKLRISCKSCRTQWVWAPPDDSLEKRELPFRCAQTGRRYVVEFGRYHPGSPYRVMDVIEEAQAIEVAREPTGPTPLLLKAPLWQRMLAPFRGKKSSGGVGKAAAGSAKTSQSFNAHDFDFDGWYCPCCNHARAGKVDSIFVRCTDCNECVCGGRVTLTRKGDRMFTCHDGCGGGGKIGGTISNFDGAPVEAPRSSVAATGLPGRASGPGLPAPSERKSGKDRPLLG